MEVRIHWINLTHNVIIKAPGLLPMTRTAIFLHFTLKYLVNYIYGNDLARQVALFTSSIELCDAL